MAHLWERAEGPARRSRATDAAALRAMIARGRGARGRRACARTRPGRLEGRFAELERERLAGIAREWLEHRARARPPFEVCRTEDDHDAFRRATCEIDGPRRPHGPPRRRRARRHRLQVRAACASAAWLGERPDDAQLPIYALAAGEGDVRAVAFARLKAGDRGFSRPLARARACMPGRRSPSRSTRRRRESPSPGTSSSRNGAREVEQAGRGLRRGRRARRPEGPARHLPPLRPASRCAACTSASRRSTRATRTRGDGMSTRAIVDAASATRRSTRALLHRPGAGGLGQDRAADPALAAAARHRRAARGDPRHHLHAQGRGGDAPARARGAARARDGAPPAATQRAHRPGELARDGARARRASAAGSSLQQCGAPAHPDDRLAVGLARAPDAGALAAWARRPRSSRTRASSTARRPSARCALVETARTPMSRDVARVLRHLDGDWRRVRALLEIDAAAARPVAAARGGLRRRRDARETLEGAFRARARADPARARARLCPRGVAALAQARALRGATTSRAASPIAVARLAEIGGLPRARRSRSADAWRALADAAAHRRRRVRARGQQEQRLSRRQGRREKARKDAMLELAGARACPTLARKRSTPCAGCRRAAFTDEQWERARRDGGAPAARRGAAHGGLRRARRDRLRRHRAGRGARRSATTTRPPICCSRSTAASATCWSTSSRTPRSRSGSCSSASPPAGSRATAARVFLVGDPMQSIYRFREAEVALFLRAREHGLPHRCSSSRVTLRTNFRSQAGIVDWVNEHFARVLPARGCRTPARCRTRRRAAHHAGARRRGGAVAPVPRHRPDAGHEARGAARGAARARDAREAAGSVAILVRSRAHLDRIVPALRKAQACASAPSTSSRSSGRPVIQDLLALTRALSHPADRVAWLARPARAVVRARRSRTCTRSLAAAPRGSRPRCGS